MEELSGKINWDSVLFGPYIIPNADWRFAGAAAHGMNALVDLGEAFGFQGPVIATSRRLITAAPNRVRAVVRGYIEAIHLFKTDRATVLPLLAEHLGFDDREAVAAAYEFYVPRFQELPQPSATGRCPYLC